MAERGRRGWLAGIVGVLAALGLAGVASAKGPSPEQELAELLQWLPGHYDNTAQEQSDMHAGVRPPHEALALDIVSIDAPMIGPHAFYLQESAADDPRRVTAQRILVFAVVKKDIVESAWTLAEPHRWRNGQLNPELFKGLLTEDLHAFKGCSLRWKRDGEHFLGVNDPKTCHDLPGVSAGQSHVELRTELGPEEYAYAELAFDKSGRLVRGRQDEPFYRFRKQSQSPAEEGASGE
ncbi:MAG TPA: chromophore lyase CpcT/CpeT [Steroidobacteraceae bacterium]